MYVLYVDYVCICAVHVHTCERVSRLVIDIHCLPHSQPELLSQGPSLKLELTNSAAQAAQSAPGCARLTPPPPLLGLLMCGTVSSGCWESEVMAS